MSLSSLFNRGLLGTRCKTCLNLIISRIKLLHNKREIQLKQMRKEIFQYLQNGQEAIARIQVEHVIREENISGAYEIIELFCEFVLARVLTLEIQKDCPLELKEATASIIYAAPRCSDLPELMQVKNLFATKYGKDFVTAATELRPDSNVNRMLIEKLSVHALSADVRLKALKRIAHEFNMEWDSAATEIDFSKKHEDLLGGGMVATPVDSISPSRSADVSRHREGTDVMEGVQLHSTPNAVDGRAASVSKMASLTGTEKIESLVGDRSGRCQGSCDALESARAAISCAERASAAARAAADLVKIRVRHPTG